MTRKFPDVRYQALPFVAGTARNPDQKVTSSTFIWLINLILQYYNIHSMHGAKESQATRTS